MESELIAHVVEELGPTLKPRAVHVIPELPKTQSGKIVRKLIRKKYLGEDAGDATTVSNPDALGTIVRS